MKDPFWQRVQALLKAHKIGQDKLADYIQINPNTLRGWIYKNRIPDAYTACDIADALGTTVEYLVRGVDGAGQKLRMQQVEERKTVSAIITGLVMKLGKATKRL